jgi:ATP-dependent helicase/nuclease subunit B
VLSEGGALRDGVAAVRASFAGLNRGLAADEARTGDAYTAHHGHIRRRATLDARGHDSLVLSASRLEALGTCPLRYFMRTVLRVRPPDDIEQETDRWLSPLQRGGLLHAVYEMTLDQARRTATEYEDAAFGDIAQGALDIQIEEYRRLQPPPGGAVFRHEIEMLRADVRAFVDKVREDAPDWVGLELSFGRGRSEPFTLELGSGTIRLAGAIDRVDRLEDGRLRIVDYKTGSSWRYRQGNTYHGGRRLQHVLYAAVARELLEAEVARVEYQFPTVRELSDDVPFTANELDDGLDVIERLLDLAASGAFHPTDDPGDCRFCDYAAVCRVSRGRGAPSSGPAEWAKNAIGQEALRTLRHIRER